MTYVVLLRGINVGGKARVEMSRLIEVCQSVGCTNVRTYINSGNVILDSSLKPDALVAAIEAGIQAEFGFVVPVIVRTADQFRQLEAAIPAAWLNDTVARTDVMFLWAVADSKDALTQIQSNPEVETFMYLPGAVVWHVLRENVRRGAGPKLIGSALYKQMTIRNINTVRKLVELLGAS